MPSVLFVCTANVCRSPMASVIFRSKLTGRADAAEWRVASAGVWGMDGSPASPGCQKALSKLQLDGSGHRAQSVSRELLQQYDLILTMERGQKEALKLEFSEFSQRIFLLNEMIGLTNDVRDPIGGGIADYEDTAMEIDRIISKGFEQILRMANRSE